jgi:acyl-CoA synthetase (NDP forming)
VDYAELSVAANLAPDVLKAARGNVKTATVTAAGFSEVGDAGNSLEASLIASAAEGGVRFIGPNCMGVYSPGGRQAFSGATSTETGHISAVLQSGGLATDLIQTAAAQGVRFNSVVSAGNTADVRLSDLVRYLAQDDATQTIGIHIEGGADIALIEALRDLDGRKPVVILLPGLSATGGRVAASHTGSMTSERRGWEALVAATGVTVTETFEEFLAALVYLDKYRDQRGGADESVLIMGLGGGSSVLAADACDARGLSVPILAENLQARLGDKKGGISINPLDVRLGPAGPPAAAREILDLVLPVQPFADTIIHVNAMNYANSVVPGRLAGIDHFIGLLENLTKGTAPHTRIAIVVRNLGHAPGEYRDLIRNFIASATIPVFERFSDAAAAIAAAQRFDRHREARKA